jgi:GT2 family glycosyltransferase
MDENKIGMAVNYYWPSGVQEGYRVITSTTLLALLFLKENPVVGTVVLADGSPDPDDLLRAECGKLGVTYLHTGRRLSLAEGYNAGWRALPEQYVGVMQNDVLPHPAGTMELLLDWIKRPDVGCVFPYLTDPANYVQHIELPVRSLRTCEPANMQLNLNVFKRSVLESIGGVDEGYATAFYDPILVIKTRRLGYRAVLVGGAKAIHIDQLTKKLGGSTLNEKRWQQDVQRWSNEYAAFATPDIYLECMRYATWPLATSLSASILWKLCYAIPVARLRFQFWRIMMWIEPFLTRYPARYGMRERVSFAAWWSRFGKQRHER